MGVGHATKTAQPESAATGDISATAWNQDHLYDLAVALGGYAVVTNVGTTYDAVDMTRGLGRVMHDFTGVTEIRLNVSVKHVGTGALTWQLWNETDGIAIGTIADALNTAWHTVAATFTTGLPTGVKILRLRVLGSVAGDDPVYGGSAMFIRKTA